jgi:hypothetical protein
MATQTTINKKTIGVSALITLGLLVAGLIGQSYLPEEKQYYCKASSTIMSCAGGLSSGLGSRCYINEEKTSWKTCSAGWLEITNDLIIQDEPQENPDVINSENMGPAVCCGQGPCTVGECE